MIALREGASVISHEHYLSGVLEVASVRAPSLCISLTAGRKRRTTTSVALVFGGPLTLAVLLRGPSSRSQQCADTRRHSRSLAQPRSRPSLQSTPAALYFKPVTLSPLPHAQLPAVAAAEGQSDLASPARLSRPRCSDARERLCRWAPDRCRARVGALRTCRCRSQRAFGPLAHASTLETDSIVGASLGRSSAAASSACANARTSGTRTAVAAAGRSHARGRRRLQLVQ